MNVGPGCTLAEKYRLVSMLGQGGMGSVWRAEHLALKSPVAVKLIDPALTENPEACARFLREAQSAASLRSPHVVQILDYGVDNEIPFIVMELLEGESLAHRLERVGHLSPAETARIMVDVCRAVGRAHQAGIVHRDLKPDNIFLAPNDESEIAKVLDFGIAKSVMPGMAAGSGTRTGAMLGTPYYMSPEQASGSKAVDWRTDIWALGIIAFECLTGRRPFGAETLGGLVLAICTEELPRPSTMAAVPAGFDAWFSRASARKQEHRFQSAKELAQALSHVCGIEPGPMSFGMGAMAGAAATRREPQVVQPLVTTTIAGSMSSTGVAQPQPAHQNRLIALVAAVSAVALCGVGVIGWRLFASPVDSVRTTVAGGTAATVATAEITLPASPASAQSTSATPHQASPPPLASASPVSDVVPLTSAQSPANEPRHRQVASPRRMPTPASPAPVGPVPVSPAPVVPAPASPTPISPAPASPAGPHSPAPNTPSGTPDPLGI